MKAAILKYPGGHGNEEVLNCLPLLSDMQVQEVWYTDEIAPGTDLLFIAGGFPCPSDLSCQDLIYAHPELERIVDFASAGKYIFGINKGFQLLCKLNLLPGRLDRNISGRFICKYVYLKPEDQYSAMTFSLNSDDILTIPIATYSGRYEAEEDVLMQMRQDGQIVFRYCDHEGRITESVNYPGSIDNIAAVCNKEKNIFGMIPQPERAFTPLAANNDGKRIIHALLQAIA